MILAFCASNSELHPTTLGVENWGRGSEREKCVVLESLSGSTEFGSTISKAGLHPDTIFKAWIELQALQLRD